VDECKPLTLGGLNLDLDGPATFLSDCGNRVDLKMQISTKALDYRGIEAGRCRLTL